MSKGIIKSSAFRPILDAPNLKEIIDELQQYWLEEQDRRLVFYNWVTPEMKVEFIDGEIVVHSPVRKSHSDCGMFLLLIIEFFNRKQKIGWVGYEKIMTRFTRNDYEPDLCFFLNEKSDLFEDEQTIFHVPDFIVEIISKSTEVRDRGIKLLDYQQHGVQEYWIIDADAKIVEQYLLGDDGEYTIPNLHTAKQIIQCKILVGLQIPVKALFDKVCNSDFVNYMLNSSEY